MWPYLLYLGLVLDAAVRCIYRFESAVSLYPEASAALSTPYSV